jgi:cephalosporin-C deacetylase-like acetyl esterase
MRNCKFWTLVLALILSPVTLAAQQGAETDSKKEASKEVTLGPMAPTGPTENWKALNDITTGLARRPPQEVQKDDLPEYTRELVRLQWRVGDPIDVWIIRPKASAKVPAILYLYSYPADPAQFRDDGWCKRATANGFAAVGFVSAFTGSRYRLQPMKKWFVSELPEAIGTSVHDVQLILNHLDARKDIDMEHIGMFGMGSGASIAVLAAQVDPRIKTLDILDPWGDWPDWLKDSPVVPENERANYTSDAFLKSVVPFDPVVYLPSLKTPHVRLQQTLSDPVTPKKAKERIAASVHDPNELVKYSNPEEHLKVWQVEGLSGWIKQQLRNPSQTSAAGDHSAAVHAESR